MAHNLFENDSLVLSQEKAWHGLGIILPDAPSLKEAMEAANLGWTVEQRRLVTSYAGEQIEVPAQLANIRSDTSEILGIVGETYKVFQNQEVADFIERVCKSSGVKVESAGSLRNGRDVFFCVKNDSFALAKGADEVETFSLFRTTHDGSASFRVLGTSVRVVCANTLNFALNGASADKGVAIRHTKNMLSRVEEAQEVLGVVAESGKQFQKQAEYLATSQWKKADVQAFFLAAYEKGNGRVPNDPKTEKENRAYRRAQGVIGSWVANMDNARQNIPGIEGTAWAAFNSITEWADHSRTIRVSDTAISQSDARMHSNIFGSAAAFKQDALQVALAAC